MPNQTIQVKISPIGGGGGGSGGNAGQISAEDYLEYDDQNYVAGVQDGAASGEVAYWDGSSWVIRRGNGQDVDYNNSNYPNLDTVRDGIDQILFEEASFNYVEFEGQDVIVKELGDEINTTIQLGWDVDKAQSELDSLSASSSDIDGDFSVIDKSSSSPVDVSLNTAITSDTLDKKSANVSLAETRPNGTTVTDSRSTVVDFQARAWYGNSSDQTPNETTVKNLQNDELRNSFLNKKTVNGGGNYIYLAWPQSMGQASKFVVGGFETTFKEYSVSVTNSFGVTKSYYVYRSLNTTSGSNLTIEIE